MKKLLILVGIGVLSACGKTTVETPSVYEQSQTMIVQQPPGASFATGLGVTIEVFVDPDTKCEYLIGTYRGIIAPRMAPKDDGTTGQICHK